MSSSPSFRRAVRIGTTLSLLTLIGSVSVASEESESVADLSIEALLELQLDQMAITGIHHTHEKGEWMVGYHFMYMGMDGNRNGTHKLSTQDVFDDGFTTFAWTASNSPHALMGSAISS
ncbi:MAG: hypothetical protein JRE13_16080 [Deltaproteobacteria bacterium]|nr:hypothetical protein [Deltaproteobacteria bacterium]